MDVEIFEETAESLLSLEADLKIGKVTIGRLLMLAYRRNILLHHIHDMEKNNTKVDIRIFSYLIELDRLRQKYFSTM
ncbi:MAG: hypothetical protein EOO46_00535 [Flavobacterium sp.]|nr:MAG: hypothetical protein EOO46_00535 [Flavobacterium sp.]